MTPHCCRAEWRARKGLCSLASTSPPETLSIPIPLLVLLWIKCSQSNNLHITVVARQGENGLSLTVCLEEAYSCPVWIRHEAESAVTWKLVQCKLHEEGSAVAYNVTVVHINKLIYRYFLNYWQIIPAVPKHDKRYNMLTWNLLHTLINKKYRFKFFLL
jgi:hypothetical protein